MIISEKQANKAKEIKERQQINNKVIDRWSIVFVLFIVAVFVSIYLISKHKIKYSWIPFVFPVAIMAFVSMSSGRVRKNEYDVLIYGKGENDCGFSMDFNPKEIDGLIIPGTTRPSIYKTANGTDLTIDKNGIVQPAGFGTRLINNLSRAGYQNEASDDCWKIK